MTYQIKDYLYPYFTALNGIYYFHATCYKEKNGGSERLKLSKLLLLSRFSCVQLCVTPHSSPPGSPIPGILQARTLEGVAISFSSA